MSHALTHNNPRYLKDAQTRLNAQLKGLELTIADVYSMQQMCAYEVIYCYPFITGSCSPETAFRPLPLDILNFVKCLLKKNGRGLIIGESRS